MKISNVEVKDLVNTYGSPLYVYDQRMIEDKLKALHQNSLSGFNDELPENDE